MIRNVLISGAGVTGLALAYWLDKAGLSTTLVEQQPEFRRGGKAVDIRGVALDVVKAMGLLEDARAIRTLLHGMSMLDANGVEMQRTKERTFSAGRLDSPDIEIFRDDLCELLMGALSDRVEFIYGDSIVGLDEEKDQVEVIFSRGNQRRFDLVIAADGLYSKTRKLWFNDETSVIKSLGIALALFTTPNFTGLENWQLMHRENGVGYVIYPSRDKQEVRVSVGFAPGDATISRGDVPAQKAMVTSKCAHLRGAFAQYIEAMQETQAFYYNELAQISAPRWYKGRVVLAGDAAHCASPLSGQGTSLGLVGAFVLARELARHPDQPTDAFAAYESRMRPFVIRNQDMVDLNRQGPTPDELMTSSKNAIDLSDLLQELA